MKCSRMLAKCTDFSFDNAYCLVCHIGVSENDGDQMST